MLNLKKTHPLLRVCNDSKINMRNGACEGLSRVSWSFMSIIIHMYWCCKSQTRFSSCEWAEPRKVGWPYSPGDYLRPEEDERQGMKDRMDEKLAPAGFMGHQTNTDEGFDIGDCLAQWYRPNFETFMVCKSYFQPRNLTSSILIFLLTSPNRKSVRSFSWFICQSEKFSVFRKTWSFWLSHFSNFTTILQDTDPNWVRFLIYSADTTLNTCNKG